MASKKEWKRRAKTRLELFQGTVAARDAAQAGRTEAEEKLRAEASPLVADRVVVCFRTEDSAEDGCGCGNCDR